jgi:S1-C subfamily serine protease
MGKDKTKGLADPALRAQYCRTEVKETVRMVGRLAAALAALLALANAAPAQPATPTVGELVSAVVRIKTFINPDGRSVGNLGRERQGSGILIDDSGLILTIGYLMVEAHAAEVVTNEGRTVPAAIVGYDHDTGFGLLRTLDSLKLKPLPIGTAAPVKDGDPVLVSSFGGLGMVAPVHVTSRREFAGSWEYLVERAIFTTPAHPAWSGAALIARDGKLVGVGSLIVGDARGDGSGTQGNMFVPVDGLMPILGDLLANGRASGPGKPWLGVNTSEVAGRLLVSRVTPASPAEKAGIRRGDIVVGIGGDATATLPAFYKKLWSLGGAGVPVPLDVTRGGESRRIVVPSAHRLDHLRLKSTF